MRSCYSCFKLLPRFCVLVNLVCSRDCAIVIELGVAIIFAMAMQLGVAHSLRCCPVTFGLPVWCCDFLVDRKGKLPCQVRCQGVPASSRTLRSDCDGPWAGGMYLPLVIRRSAVGSWPKSNTVTGWICRVCSQHGFCSFKVFRAE